MLLDLLSTDNYISFNICLAKKFGLVAAIYLSEIIRVCEKATRKKAFNEEGYFKLNRNYVEDRTTISVKEQLDIDKVLMPLHIISKPKSNSDEMQFNADILASIVMEADEKLDKDIKKIVSQTSKSRMSKREYQKENMKKFIQVSNDELREAYYKWLDGVFANPKGFLSGGAVEAFIQDIDNFSNHDLDVALDVIKIATIGGYRDAQWAINQYENQHPSRTHTTQEDRYRKQTGELTTL